MKHGNGKEKLYIQELKKQLVKQSDGTINEIEAAIAAKEVTKVLLKSGDSLDVKTVRQTARWIVDKKKKVDNGTLSETKDGFIYDAEENKRYKK